MNESAPHPLFLALLWDAEEGHRDGVFDSPAPLWPGDTIAVTVNFALCLDYKRFLNGFII